MKTIALIGAMREEITPLLSRIGKYESIEFGGNTYYKANYQGYNLIIAYSKIGKIHASITCCAMIMKFNADYIIFTGVAGGLASDLRIGDVVLATSLCQCDVDISVFGHPLGFIPESSVYIKTSEILNNIAKRIATTHNIKLKEGIIASCDSFVSDSAKKQWIVENFNAAAVEMEGASIAVTANLLEVPFCVIRSISDTADEEANISFDEFLDKAAENSATFTLSMIDEMAKIGL